MSQQSLYLNQFRQRMKMGTGVASVLYGNPNNSHHYVDSYQRFSKDYASIEKQRRDQERLRKMQDNQRRRIQFLERESKRWKTAQEEYNRQRVKTEQNLKRQFMGIKRTPKSNGLPYNPINLQYEKNPQGQKLRTKDQDHYVRGLVRAHNIDNKGNSRFNPLTGQQYLIQGNNRSGVETRVPTHLNNLFKIKLQNHYDAFRIKLPSLYQQGRINTEGY